MYVADDITLPFLYISFHRLEICHEYFLASQMLFFSKVHKSLPQGGVEGVLKTIHCRICILVPINLKFGTNTLYASLMFTKINIHENQFQTRLAGL